MVHPVTLLIILYQIYSFPAKKNPSVNQFGFLKNTQKKSKLMLLQTHIYSRLVNNMQTELPDENKTDSLF